MLSIPSQVLDIPYSYTAVHRNPDARPSGYRPDIDGLRAVAILGVIMFHANCTVTGGFIGVDIFFVISGFLITRFIQQSIDNNNFSFLEFWVRRVCRILPASAVMVFVTLFLGGLILLPYDLHELGEGGVANLVFLSNFYHWYQLHGYFAKEAEWRPLLHTWSLAVEEQFYLLYPFVLFALRKTSIAWRRWIIIALIAVSFGFTELAMHAFPDACFFMLPFRAWELLAGGLVFTMCSTTRLHRILNEMISVVGAIMMILPMWSYTGNTIFPGMAAVPPVVGTAMIIFANGNGRTIIGRLLSFRALVFVGLLSYSLYLWHWPLLVFAHYLAGVELPALVLCSVLALTAMLAWLSYAFVEIPFRKAVHHYQPLRILMIGLGISAGLGIVSFAFVQSNGWPSRFGNDMLAKQDAGFENLHWLRHDAQSVPNNLPRMGLMSSSPTILLWGDSHVPAVADMLDELLYDANISGCVAARSTDPPIIEKGGKHSGASEWNNAVLQYAERSDIVDVIIISRWSTWLTNIEAYERVKERLARLTSAGKRCWLVRQVPEQSFNVSRALYATRYGFATQPPCTLEAHTSRQKTANIYLDKLVKDQIHVLDPTPYCFNSHGVSLIGSRLRSYYRDNNHISSYGASVFFKPVFSTEVMNELRAHRKRSARNGNGVANVRRL